MAKKKQHSFFERNGLSIVSAVLLLVFLGGQFFTGWAEYNQKQVEDGFAAIGMAQYACSGHFIQATFENWESEFLQMTFYVLLTVFLHQQGSAESKELDKEEEVDREPKAHKNAPGPVKKGGIWLKLYSHSLSIAFGLLFIISFVLHFWGSLKDHNEELLERNLPVDSWTQYIAGPRFWFESFQNWQSEFLAVLCIVLFTVWLREKGSPESKPVDAAHDEHE